MNTTSIAMSNVAMMEAQAARETACRSYEFQFDSRTATTEQKQEYAECIDLLYPKHGLEIDDGTIRIILMVAFSCAALFAWLGHESWDEPFDYIIRAFFGFVLGPIALGVLFGVGYGFFWMIGIV